MGIYTFIENYRNLSDLECVKLVNSSMVIGDTFITEGEMIVGWMYYKKEDYKKALSLLLAF